MRKNTSLEILAVRRSDLNETELLNFSIDHPETGDRINSSEVQLQGWVIGKISPAIAVELVLNNKVLCTLPINDLRPDVVQVYPQLPEAGISGFLTTLDLSYLPQEGILDLYVLLRDQSYVCLGNLSFRHNVDALSVDNHLIASAINIDDQQRELKFKRIEVDLERSQALLQQAKAQLAQSSIL